MWEKRGVLGRKPSEERHCENIQPPHRKPQIALHENRTPGVFFFEVPPDNYHPGKIRNHDINVIKNNSNNKKKNISNDNKEVNIIIIINYKEL